MTFQVPDDGRYIGYYDNHAEAVQLSQKARDLYDDDPESISAQMIEAFTQQEVGLFLDPTDARIMALQEEAYEWLVANDFPFPDPPQDVIDEITESAKEAAKWREQMTQFLGGDDVDFDPFIGGENERNEA